LESHDFDPVFHEDFPEAQENIPNPEPGEVWFHGGRKDLKKTSRALYLTKDRSIAKGFTEDLKSSGIHEIPVHIKNPAHVGDVLPLLKEMGWQKDYHAVGSKLLDMVSMPHVMKELKKRGFDSFIGWDNLRGLSKKHLEPTLVLFGYDPEEPTQRSHVGASYKHEPILMYGRGKHKNTKGPNLSSFLYGAARNLNDLEKVLSGDPKKMVTRLKNKFVGKHLVRKIWKWP